MKNTKLNEVTNYINTKCSSPNSKRKLLNIITDKTPVSSIDVKALKLVFYTKELKINLIMDHILYLYKNYKAKRPCDEKNLRKQLSLYLVNHRLSELVEFKEYTKKYGQEVIEILPYIKKEFIINNEDNIFKLLKMINDKKYLIQFRKGLVHVDECLYKDTIK